MPDFRKMKRASSVMAAAAAAGFFGLALCEAQQPAAEAAGKTDAEAAKAVAVPAPYLSLEDQRKTLEEGQRLVAECRAKLAAGDVEAYSNAVSHIWYPYDGDPAPLMEDLWSSLSKTQRDDLASSFLRVGLHREESIAALRAVVRDKGIKDRGLNDYEHPPWSPRVVAARTLCYAGAKEAADDIWALYRERSGKDKDLPSLLAKLGDERPRQVVAKVTLDARGDIEHTDLLAHYRVAEAVEPLKKELAAQKALEHPSYLLFNAEAALFQITGDASYLQGMLEHVDLGSFARLAETRRPEAQALLQKVALDELAIYRRNAFVELSMKYPGDPAVRKIVVESLDQKAMPRDIDGETLMRVALALRDPEIDAKGQAYYQATGDRNWMKAYYRRNLPLGPHELDY